eukprot:350564_1
MATPNDMENEFEGAMRVRQPKYGRRRGERGANVPQKSEEEIGTPSKKKGWGEDDQGQGQLDLDKLKALESEYFGGGDDDDDSDDDRRNKKEKPIYAQPD